MLLTNNSLVLAPNLSDFEYKRNAYAEFRLATAAKERTETAASFREAHNWMQVDDNDKNAQARRLQRPPVRAKETHIKGFL
jgi:hypothetical protein